MTRLKARGSRYSLNTHTLETTFVHRLFAECEFFPAIASSGEPDHQWVLTLDMRITNGGDFTPFTLS